MKRLSLLRVALVALTFWSWNPAGAAREVGAKVAAEQYTGLVTVRHIERTVSGAVVTPCDGEGRPLSKAAVTGTDGHCRVAVPGDRCRLRIEHAGDILWSGEIFLLPNEPMPVVLDLYELARQPTNDPTPERMDGEPLGASLTASIRADGDLNDPSADGQGWSNWKIYYYVNDHLGTPVAMIDEDGCKVWRADLMPFGETLNETGPVANPFRFPGQYRDPETGFHYNWYRFLDSSKGRYLAVDPVEVEVMQQRYGYADLDPISNFDLNGLEVLLAVTDLVPVYYLREGKSCEKIAATKLIFGGTMVGVGLVAGLTGQELLAIPSIRYGGPMLADGFATTLASLLGGDTSCLPKTDTDAAFRILDKVVSNQDTHHDIVSFYNLVTPLIQVMQ